MSLIQWCTDEHRGLRSRISANQELLESALSSEREETALLRATLRGLRGVQEQLQNKQDEKNKLAKTLDGFISDGPESLQRRGVSDRLMIQGLEKQLTEAKQVVNLLNAELERLRNDEFLTSDHSSKCSQPNRPLADIAASHRQAPHSRIGVLQQQIQELKGH
ncbi:hypothetical protein Efla_004402 [Eimeria flavescens]